MLEVLEIGVISSTHGLKGEVNVYPTTDEPSRFRDLETVMVRGERVDTELTVERVSFFKGKPIVKFKGLDQIEDVMKLRGCSLCVRRSDALPLEEGQYFIGDLIGSRVLLENGDSFGTLADILRTGANDVYVVKKTDGETALLASIPEVVRSIDAEKQVIVVRPMREV